MLKAFPGAASTLKAGKMRVKIRVNDSDSVALQNSTREAASPVLEH
jgi:hypothetical protein